MTEMLSPAAFARRQQVRKPASEKQMAFLHRLMDEKQMDDEEHEGYADMIASNPSAVEASSYIDSLMKMPRKDRAPIVHADGGSIEEGYYWVEGIVYKVQKSAAGRHYAKQFGDGGYEYAPGAMRVLQNAERLTVEQAAEMGVKTGRCVVCARLLTDPESVAAGIGPICATRLRF